MIGRDFPGRMDKARGISGRAHRVSKSIKGLESLGSHEQVGVAGVVVWGGAENGDRLQWKIR